MSRHAKKHWWHNSKPHTLLFSFLLAGVIVGAGVLTLYVGNLIIDRQTRLKSTPVNVPQRLIIPAIDVDALVQEVGLALSGRMGVPSNFTDVAWYKAGPKPGEAGSAVIDGHLDTAVDAKAVFAKLSELKLRDKIEVVDKAGQKIRFRVVHKEIYEDASAPLEKIFNQKGALPRLNLVTCDGAWDQNTRNYDKRLVVYSERVF